MKKRRWNTTKKGTQYEYHVAWKMRLHGFYFVNVCGKSADYGGDITARCFPFGTIVVQCKNYKGKVGVQAVQEAYAAKRFYGTSRAAVATNSDFTKNAEILAAKCKVELWRRY